MALPGALFFELILATLAWSVQRHLQIPLNKIIDCLSIYHSKSIYLQLKHFFRKKGYSSALCVVWAGLLWDVPRGASGSEEQRAGHVPLAGPAARLRGGNRAGG